MMYYFAQLCCGLQQLHEKKLAHKNLTTQCIYFAPDSNEVIRIGDFGAPTHVHSHFHK